MTKPKPKSMEPVCVYGLITSTIITNFICCNCQFCRYFPCQHTHNQWPATKIHQKRKSLHSWRIWIVPSNYNYLTANIICKQVDHHVTWILKLQIRNQIKKCSRGNMCGIICSHKSTKTFHSTNQILRNISKMVSLHYTRE